MTAFTPAVILIIEVDNIDSLSNTKENIHKQYTKKVDKTKKEYQKENTNLKGKINDKNNEITTLKNDINNLNTTISTKDSKIDSLTEMNKT